MSGVIDDWDAVPVKAGPTQAPAESKSAGGGITSDWDAVPLTMPKSEPAATKSGPGIVDKAIGAGEAALGVLSSIPAAIPGGIAAVSSILTNGKYGTQEGVREAANRFHDVSGAYTYEPRTDTGKEYLGNVGNAINDSGIVGVAPMAVGAAGTVKPVTTAASDLTKSFLAKKGELPVSARIEPTMGVKPEVVPTAAETPAPRLTTANASPEVRAAIEKASKKGPVNPEIVNRHLEADSLPVKMELTAGQASQDVSQLSHEQNLRGKHPEMAQRFNQQNGQLIENANAIRDKAAPDITATNHVENGQALIESYHAKDAALSADISAKYKALEDANGGQFPIDGKSFVAAADQALSKKMKGRYVPPEVQADMDSLRSGGAMTFENFENMRTNLAAEARKAERAGDGNRAMAVNIVRDALESLPIEGEAANLKPLADAARNAARERFTLLEKDPAYKAAVHGTVAPDDFINKFVINGKAGNVKTMKANLASDPLAQQTMAAGTMNYLKAKAGIVNENGNFSQAGYNKALEAVRPKLGELFSPEHARQVQTLGNVSRYTQAQPRGSFVNNSNTLVAGITDVAKNAMEGAANYAAFGVPVGTFARKVIQNKSQANTVKKALEPGAGVKLSEFP